MHQSIPDLTQFQSLSIDSNFVVRTQFLCLAEQMKLYQLESCAAAERLPPFLEENPCEIC